MLHPPDGEARLCRVMVAAGDVDGLTGEAQPSVDSLPLAVHRALLGTLRELASHFSIRRGGPPRVGEQETA